MTPTVNSVRLVAAAVEHRSIAIGHSPRDGDALPDQPTAVSCSTVRHHAHIITTTGDSYRLTPTGGN